MQWSSEGVTDLLGDGGGSVLFIMGVTNGNQGHCQKA